MITTMPWHHSWCADPRALPLADRHYSRQKPGSNQFVPPGRRCVFLTENADALTVDLAGYDAYWASPLCQGYSVTQNIWQRDYPLLIEPIRARLQRTGKPWIIENVVGAPLDGVTLCGVMFGLRVQRHRVFESNCLLLQPPHMPHRGACAPTGRPPRGYEYMTVAGHFSDVAWARQCMGIDWMTREELAEAIPPAYSAYLGAQLLRYVTKDAA